MPKRAHGVVVAAAMAHSGLCKEIGEREERRVSQRRF